MKRILRKALTWILTICMILTMVPMSVIASDIPQEEPVEVDQQYEDTGNGASEGVSYNDEDSGDPNNADDPDRNLSPCFKIHY